ncbi:MAG: lytic transglycosylase domain-containing protein [Saprospiraceae bacterium]|nr:lytic transglycosylase domain-containing protein [Saprospiraceae bacterium]
MEFRNKIKFFGLPLFLVIAIISFFSWSSKEKAALAPFFDLPQQIRSVKLSRDFTFAGEKVPLNDDTRERLDRELLVNAYWQSTTLLHLKMAYKYFPEIKPILEKNNIPEDFLYLSVAESSLRNATSSANAKGFWQFMKPTAMEFGLIINDEIDERYHLEKSTLAACRYIKQMKSRFHNWTNVAGAYNMGPTAFAAAMVKQKEDSYYDLSISEETSRYVFRIIAIKEIMRNPSDFGYYIEDEHHYKVMPIFRYVSVDKPITSLADFAHVNGLTYRLLKYYNPWLISDKVSPVPGSEIKIRIPENISKY